jgi:hypothetical protein
MGLLQEQRQQAGARRIWLQWLICSHCHHVALNDWALAESESAGAAQEADAPRPAPQRRTRD